MAYELPTKAQIGLGNVDNTSDTNKPVSTAMQSALDALSVSAYKSYQAVITQTGISAPSATEYVNQTGAIMTWARSVAGVYTLTANSNVFTANKTVVILSNPITSLVSYIVVPTSTSVITLSTFLASVIATVLTATLTDALITNLLVEVRVYT